MNGKMDAKYFWNLAQNNDESYPRLEAHQYGLGYVVGDKSKPEDRSQNKNCAHQKCEHRRRSNKSRRIRIRNNFTESRCGQYGDR